MSHTDALIEKDGNRIHVKNDIEIPHSAISMSKKGLPSYMIVVTKLDVNNDTYEKSNNGIAYIFKNPTKIANFYNRITSDDSLHTLAEALQLADEKHIQIRSTFSGITNNNRWELYTRLLKTRDNNCFAICSKYDK